MADRAGWKAVWFRLAGQVVKGSGVTISNEHEPAGTDLEGGGATGSWQSRAVVFGVCVAILVAFRAVLIAPFIVVEPEKFEYWFFIPGRDSGAISVLLAVWLVWNRRKQLIPTGVQRIGLKTGVAAISVCLAFSWAIFSGALALLVPILCAELMVLATVWKGRSGIRAVAMPCVALLLAFPPPDPLLSEIIWRLQGLTAEGSHLLLSLAGLPVQIEGTELRLGEYAFVVIESCSGWRGIQILSIVGLAACELRSVPLPRALWVVLLAVPLGIALNVARVCLVVLTKEEMSGEIFENHTPQGIAVLMIGSVILYAAAAWLQRHENRAGTTSEELSRVAAVPPGRVSVPAAVFGLGLPLALSLLSLVIPRIVGEPESSDHREIGFSAMHISWRATAIPIDYFFPYSTVAHPQYHFAFKRQNDWGGMELADLFIARELRDPSGLNRLPDTKLILPASDWQVVSREPMQIWRLGLEGQQAILSRKAESMFIYVVAWRYHDDGLLRESFKSLLGLDACGSLRGRCFRTVLRVAVPILHNDEPGRARAKVIADDFIRDFEDSFEALARE